MDLWLNENIYIFNTNINNSFYLKYCYPCARQCITEYLTYNKYSRIDYIAVPEYLGNCVLNAINKISTTVPFIFLNKDNIKKIKCILIYDQWGWEKDHSSIEYMKTIYNCQIILDRVDTLLNYKNISDISGVDAQIFSLNKTLGIGGGGLIFCNNDYHKTNMSCENNICNVFTNYDNYKNYDFFDHLFKNNFNEYPPLFKKNIETQNIDCLIDYEMNCRQNNLDKLMNNLEHTLPTWMISQYKLRKSLPGIFPLCLANLNDTIILYVKDVFNLDIKILNFNFSEKYDYFNWKKVLAIPLHSKISIDLNDLISYIKLKYKICSYDEL